MLRLLNFKTLIILSLFALNSTASELTLESFFDEIDTIKEVNYNNPEQGRAMLLRYKDVAKTFPAHAALIYYSQLSISNYYLNDFETAFELVDNTLKKFDKGQTSLPLYESLMARYYAAEALEKHNLLDDLERILTIAQNLNNADAIITAQRSLAFYFLEENKLILAYQYAIDSLSTAEDAGDEINIPHSKFVIAQILNRMGRFDEAIAQALAAANSYKAQGDYYSVISALNIVGGIYANMGEYEQALNYFDRQIETAEQNNLENLKLMPITYKARVLKKLGRNEESLSLLNSIESFVKQGKHPYENYYTLNKVDVLLNLGLTEQAEKLLAAFENEKGEANLSVVDQINYKKIKAKTLENNGDFKDAFYAFKDYIQSDLDSQKIQSDGVLGELSIKYEMNKKAKEAERLKYENATNKLKLESSEKERRNQLVMIGFITVISVVTLLFLISQIFLRRKLASLVIYDSLTSVLNRYALMKNGKQLEDDRRSGEFSVIMLDIDNFKGINDNFGHDIGDNVLKAFAEIGTESVRDKDHFGRLGGEEFVIILPKTKLHDSIVVAERFMQKLSEYDWQSIGLDRDVTASIGISSSPTNTEKTFDCVLREADDAMYYTKRNGRNGYNLFSEITPSIAA